MELGQLDRDSWTYGTQSVEIQMDILDFWGVNTCNSRLANSPVESANGTSHFVTQIKKKQSRKLEY